MWIDYAAYNTDERVGFNRYMVECEYVPPLSFHPPERRFNRYMVECEYIIIGGLDSGTSGFNRYMVECE